MWTREWIRALFIIPLLLLTSSWSPVPGSPSAPAQGHCAGCEYTQLNQLCPGGPGLPGPCNLAVLFEMPGSDGICEGESPNCIVELPCSLTLRVKYQSSCDDNTLVIQCDGGSPVVIQGGQECTTGNPWCTAWYRNATLPCKASNPTISCTASLTNQGATVCAGRRGSCSICE